MIFQYAEFVLAVRQLNLTKLSILLFQLYLICQGTVGLINMSIEVCDWKHGILLAIKGATISRSQDAIDTS